MQKKYTINKLYHKFSKGNAGILFINSVPERIEISLKIAEYEISNFDYLLWIAPANFLNTLRYKNEIKKNCQSFRHRVLYYAIESISVSDQVYLELYNLIINHKTFCIVDESLVIKNTQSERTQRLLNLSRFFTYKLILSCPPVTLGLIDLYAQIEFLNSKILKMNSKQFKDIFMPAKYKNYMIQKRWSRPEDENKLLGMLKPYILGHDINKPFKINHFDRFFDLTPQEEQSYQEEKIHYLNKKNRIVFMDIAQTFQKIYTLSYNKLIGLKKLITQIHTRQEKALIYVKFIHEIDFIRESKILNDLPIVELSKRTNKKKAIKAFERNTDFLFCTYGVEKFGLNMQLCHNIIYYSQTFDYRCKVQSLNSFFFTGLPSEINVYDFWMHTNLEKFIKDSLEHKEFLLSNIYQKITRTEALKL